MNNFVAVTLPDMDAFLSGRGFSVISVAGVNETVYGRAAGMGLVLAVFTGIEDGVSRGKGKDAVRLSLMKGGRVVLSLPHVKRQTNWRTHLAARLSDWTAVVGPDYCPACNSVMLRRDGRRGPFYGCTEFPECKSTLPV